MSVPALYLFGADEPLQVTVRRHNRYSKTGDIPGLETVDIADETVFLRFLVAELAQPKRNALVTISATEGYRLGQILPPHGITVDAAVTRLDDAEMAGLSVPE